MKKEKKFNDDDLIDFVELFSNIYSNKNKIKKISITFLIIGIAFSLLLPNIYKSSSTFYPHYEKIDESNNIRNLAGLAGINLQNENTNTIPPNLYPELISSNKFKLEILDTKISYDNKNITYREYLTESDLKSIDLKSLFLYPIKFFKKKFFKKKEKVIIEELTYISQNDHDLFKLLENKILLKLNNEDGVIELVVYDKIPEISSIIAIKANEILQNSIIEFKLKNIKDIFSFTKKQLEISKNNLYKIQDSLANFRDSNKSIKSDIFKNQLNRLETEYNISKNIYNELALTKEKTEIDVRKNTPIFTILKSVSVPIQKDSPNRILIIILFTISGALLSMFWFSLKSYINDLYNDIKK